MSLTRATLRAASDCIELDLVPLTGIFQNTLQTNSGDFGPNDSLCMAKTEFSTGKACMDVSSRANDRAAGCRDAGTTTVTSCTVSGRLCSPLLIFCKISSNFCLKTRRRIIPSDLCDFRSWLAKPCTLSVDKRK